MEFTCNKTDLTRILTRAASAAAVKSPIAALCCVLLEVIDGKVTARATDSYVGVETFAPAKVKTTGVVAIGDAKRAANVVKDLPAGDVLVRIVKNHVEVSSKKAKFKLEFLPSEDFPQMPRPGDAAFTIPARELARAIGQGSYAMALTDAAPQLHGALFDRDGDLLRIVSTDGHRLAIGSAPAQGKVPTMLVPPRAITEIKRMCDGDKEGAIAVSFDRGMAFFTSGDYVLSAKCRDDAFPPYRKLTITPDKCVTLRRDDISAALKRVSLMSKKDDGQLDLTFSSGQVRIATRDGSGEDVVECDCDADFATSANWEYLAQAINAVADDEVKLQMARDTDPIRVEPATSSDCSGLVMPMRR